MAGKKIIENFIVTNEKGEKFDLSLELIKSDSPYGNGHYLVLTDGGNENLFDARYDGRFTNESTFRENAYSFVRDYVRPSCGVSKA